MTVPRGWGQPLDLRLALPHVGLLQPVNPTSTPASHRDQPLGSRLTTLGSTELMGIHLDGMDLAETASYSNLINPNQFSSTH
jgi:hypothetical protein